MTGIFKAASAVVLALSLSACMSATDKSLSNPNYASAELKDGVLTGSYNPASYDARLIRNQIKSICVDEKLSGYGEQASENGLVSFSAHCTEGSTLSRAFMSIERLPSGNFSVSTTGA